MNTSEILIRAARDGVTFWLDDGRLAYRAPKGKMTSEFRDEIIRQKESLISMLRQGEAAAPRQIEPSTISGEHGHPLSSGQERIWLIERRIGKSALHNVHFRLLWRGLVDRDALWSSVQDIAARHTPLRTTFAEINGAPRAIISPEPAIDLTFLDLTSHEHDAKASATMSFIYDHEHSPFELGRGPLIRTGLITLDEDDHIFLVTQHHIITDGWSVGIFLTELAQSYQAKVLGEKPSIAELPLGYPDYAQWQLELRDDRTYQENTQWWKEHLDGVHPLALRVDNHVHPPIPDHSGATEQFRIPRTLESQLRALAREQECTLYTILLAAWTILLYRHSGQNDFTIGTITSGRDRDEFQRLLGFFANTVVLRCDFSGNPSVIDAISRLRIETKLALEREVQYTDALLTAGAVPGASPNPFIQATFVFENIPMTRALNLKDMHGNEVQITLDPQIDSSVDGTTKFDLSLFVKESYGDVSGCIRYSRAKFCAPAIQRLRERFLMMLKEMIKDPSEQVGRLALLSAEERQKLLIEWGGGETSGLYAFPVHHDTCQGICHGRMVRADHAGQWQAS